ncbi:MAG: hypothetical protein KC731_29340, partial [Myxococcales bacterium]|nr:hypothetical protein [Myxococcales bacterium]
RNARKVAKGIGRPMPEGAFAIVGHLGSDYLYLPAEGGIDEVVHLVSEDEPERSGPYYASVLAWVDDLAEGAIGAWESGYFELHPNGTQA